VCVFYQSFTPTCISACMLALRPRAAGPVHYVDASKRAQGHQQHTRTNGVRAPVEVLYVSMYIYLCLYAPVEVLPVPGGPYSSRCGSLLFATNRSTAAQKYACACQGLRAQGTARTCARRAQRPRDLGANSREARRAQLSAAARAHPISRARARPRPGRGQAGAGFCGRWGRAAQGSGAGKRRCGGAAAARLRAGGHSRVDTMSVCAITSPSVSGRYFSTHGVASAATAGVSPPLDAAAPCSSTTSISSATTPAIWRETGRAGFSHPTTGNRLPATGTGALKKKKNICIKSQSADGRRVARRRDVAGGERRRGR